MRKNDIMRSGVSGDASVIKRDVWLLANQKRQIIFNCDIRTSSDDVYSCFREIVAESFLNKHLFCAFILPCLQSFGSLGKYLLSPLDLNFIAHSVLFFAGISVASLCLTVLHFLQFAYLFVILSPLV